MADDSSKRNLSKNVLQMKFMKRSALRIEKEKSEEERKYIIDDEHWVLDLPKMETMENKFIFEPSYTRCENLMFGRMSFKGFNPEIEKLMKLKNNEMFSEETERRENEISVNDQEMAERYESLVGTISKKFANKRHRQAESYDTKGNKKLKRQFQRPIDD